MSRYVFSHYKSDENNPPFPEVSETRKTIDFAEDFDPWTPVLYEFCNFLSGIYGYNITQQVFVERHNFHDSEAEMVPLSDAI